MKFKDNEHKRRVFLNCIENAISVKEYNDFLEDFFDRKIKKKRVRNYIADLFEEVEKQNVAVTFVRMNTSTYTHVKEYLGNECVLETNKQKLEDRIMGTLWGATILIDNSLSFGFIALNKE